MRRLALHPSVALLVALAGCTSPGPKGDDSGKCTPVANAGDDVAGKLGSTVTVDGKKSTSCGSNALAYTWTFLQVPPDSVINDSSLGANNGTAAEQQANFVPDETGSYVLSLTVTDGSATSSADVVVVTVSSDNLAPIANAGPDSNCTVGKRCLLDGTGSSDPEGAALTYDWAFSSIPDGSALGTVDLYDATSDHASFIPDAGGVYSISLTVNDSVSESGADYVQITVDSANQRPIADAGSNKTLAPCNGNTIKLNGYGSYDPDGDTITYEWKLSSAPSGSAATDAAFDDATKPDAAFTWDVPGDYTFALQVNDGNLKSAEDIVTMTVTDPGTNNAPIANAGADQTISASGECTSASYVWSCQACDAQKVTVDGSSSTDPDGDSLSYHWYDDTDADPATIDSPYTAYTVVRTPEVDATYGSANSTTMTLTLQVADCSAASTDQVAITVECTGAKASK